MEQDFNAIFNCFISILLCFLLSVAYLASIHVWNSPYSRRRYVSYPSHRTAHPNLKPFTVSYERIMEKYRGNKKDHPTTIKKRFVSAFVMLFIAPCFLYVGLDKTILEKVPFLEILGLKTEGLCQAIFMPLFLTMILFLGPISMELYSGLSKLYTEEMYWFSNVTNLIWIRNHIAAPLSEEFTYRSCMLPLLLQCFKPTTAVIISPLFFGVAHFHHMRERIKYMGMDFNTALKISCFQFVYTTIFGMYSSYIFYRTGHFISLFIVHAFCNHMGFPEIIEISTYKRNKKMVITSLFFIGFIAWCFLLKPLTEPNWYYNKPTWYKL